MQLTESKTIRHVLKPLVFIASLGPSAWLVWAALTGHLSANPAIDRNRLLARGSGLAALLGAIVKGGKHEIARIVICLCLAFAGMGPGGAGAGILAGFCNAAALAARSRIIGAWSSSKTGGHKARNSGSEKKSSHTTSIGDEDVYR